jgi:cytosine/adenosine deaminase-related metal-dependent hydrolase
MLADFVAVDLDHAALVGWQPDSLAALITLSAPASVISDVWVNGVLRIRNGRHIDDDSITASYRTVVKQQI